MKEIDKNALDRWITGNYGEDAYREDMYSDKEFLVDDGKFLEDMENMVECETQEEDKMYCTDGDKHTVYSFDDCKTCNIRRLLLIIKKLKSGDEG